MDVKEAVSKARRYMTSVFADEDLSELRLEEVEYDRAHQAWLITLGLTRRTSVGNKGLLSELSPTAQRIYKVVRVPEDQEDQLSIKIREVAS